MGLVDGCRITSSGSAPFLQAPIGTYLDQSYSGKIPDNERCYVLASSLNKMVSEDEASTRF